jgi:hypothetical protein
MKPWVIFAFSAALFWGAYVPTIFYGQMGFGAANPNRSMKAFLFIGLAYFLLAIIVPGVWLMSHPSPKDTGWPMGGMVLSTIAGALGAAGALCVVFSLRAAAMDNLKNMILVAPIVFAGAPIVNVLISYIIDAFKGKAEAPSPMFAVGLLMAAAGVAIVLLFNPAAHAAPPAKPAVNDTPANVSSPGALATPSPQQ